MQEALLIPWQIAQKLKLNITIYQKTDNRSAIVLMNSIPGRSTLHSLGIYLLHTNIPKNDSLNKMNFYTE